MRTLKIAALAATALALTACGASLNSQVAPLHTPEDCYLAEKQSHPDFITECGNKP